MRHEWVARQTICSCRTKLTNHWSREASIMSGFGRYNVLHMCFLDIDQLKYDYYRLEAYINLVWWQHSCYAAAHTPSTLWSGVSTLISQLWFNKPLNVRTHVDATCNPSSDQFQHDQKHASKLLCDAWRWSHPRTGHQSQDHRMWFPVALGLGRFISVLPLLKATATKWLCQRPGCDTGSMKLSNHQEHLFKIVTQVFIHTYSYVCIYTYAWFHM